jgi:hypothetical protein
MGERERERDGENESVAPEKMAERMLNGDGDEKQKSSIGKPSLNAC